MPVLLKHTLTPPTYTYEYPFLSLYVAYRYKYMYDCIYYTYKRISFLAQVFVLNIV